MYLGIIITPICKKFNAAIGLVTVAQCQGRQHCETEGCKHFSVRYSMPAR